MRLTFDGRDYELPAGTRVSIQFPAVQVLGAAAGAEVSRGATLELQPQAAINPAARTQLERQEQAARDRKAARASKAAAGPGRGRKKCPECNEIVGNKTTLCMCGHRW